MYLDRRGAGRLIFGPFIFGPFILESAMVASTLRAADSVGAPTRVAVSGLAVFRARRRGYWGGFRNDPGTRKFFSEGGELSRPCPGLIPCK
jgi:hypothetical protein